MQDRFKFRAINMKTKEVTYIDTFYWFESEGICEIDKNNTASGSFAEYYINQCTGLKDKNGKLIYEGDIVKTSKGIANVEYDNTYAYFGLTNFLTVFSFDNFINEEIEVIGNIYDTLIY